MLGDAVGGWTPRDRIPRRHSLGRIDGALPYPGTCSVGCGSRSGRRRILRALIIHHAVLRRPDPLPVGTLLVNASGSLLLGILTGLSMYHGLGPHDISMWPGSAFVGASPRGPPPVGSRCTSFGTATAQRRGCTPSAGSRSALLSPRQASASRQLCELLSNKPMSQGPVHRQHSDDRTRRGVTTREEADRNKPCLLGRGGWNDRVGPSVFGRGPQCVRPAAALGG